MSRIDAVSQMKDAALRGRMPASLINEADADLQMQPSLPVGLEPVRLALDLPARKGANCSCWGESGDMSSTCMNSGLQGFLLRPFAKHAPYAP